MTPGKPHFPDPPRNPSGSSGHVAQILRETLQESSFGTQRELAEAISYRVTTVSDMLSGRRVQGSAFVKQFVEKCIPDSQLAQQRIREINTILENARATPEASAEEIPYPGLDPDKEPSAPTFWSLRRGLGSWRSRSWAAVTLGVVMLVLVGVVVSVGTLLSMSCGDGVSRIDSQCIGVTDGSVNVTDDPQFDDILAKIRMENQRVLAGPDDGPVVSVAYTAPFAKEPGTALGVQLRKEIEGAYLVQLRANGTSGPNPLSGSPRVQLLIANLGDSAEYFDQAVNDLTDRASPAETAPLVAVVGLDQSIPGVKQAIDLLGQQRIPMVAGRLTLDTISPDPSRSGFYSVASSLKAQVAAGSTYLGRTAKRPLIVVDRNPEDIYGSYLADQLLRPSLRAAIGSGTTLADESYDSSLAGLNTTLAQMSPSICIKNPDVIFFAGRGADLPAFIRGLGLRACQSTPFTVVTVSDGRILAQEIEKEDTTGGERLLASSLRTGVRVLVTAQAHPGKWTPPSVQFPEAAHAQLSGACGSCFPTLFPDQSLDDGDTIIGHDAMLVAVSAIRLGSSQLDPTVSAQTVRQALARITPQVPVLGASGPIGYGPQAGFPTTKPIPITDITPDGEIRLVGSIDQQQLTGPAS